MGPDKGTSPAASPSAPAARKPTWAKASLPLPVSLHASSLPPPSLGVERALEKVRTLPPPLLGVEGALETVRTLPPPLLGVESALLSEW